MKPETLPAWCFLTGQFLFGFEQKKRLPHYIEVHKDFLAHIETVPPVDDFFYNNPAIVIMLCYGLLVYPVEYWNNFLADELSMKRLDKNMVNIAVNAGVHVNSFTELFDVAKWNGTKSESNFMRKLRNAIAHSHIKVDMMNNLFTFWNVDKSKNVDFEISTSTVNLGIFLTGLGRHFSSGQRHIR